MGDMFNVLICGTPGTGKSTLAEIVKRRIGNELNKSAPIEGSSFKFLNLSKFALDNNCTCGYDERLESHDIDEDKLRDKLEPIMVANKYNILEAIEPDFLSADLFNLVFVCRTNNTILYDRLKERNYNEDKISENVTAEIFQLILDRARELFTSTTCDLFELVNDTESDLDRNSHKILSEIKASISRRPLLAQHESGTRDSLEICGE